MAWGKRLAKIVGMICPPGKPHSGNFLCCHFLTPPPPPCPPNPTPLSPRMCHPSHAIMDIVYNEALPPLVPNLAVLTSIYNEYLIIMRPSPPLSRIWPS